LRFRAGSIASQYGDPAGGRAHRPGPVARLIRS
jgi:hypothetical protein